MKKVLFVSSAGGHLSELMQLKHMFNKYDTYIMTEKTESTLSLKKEFKNVLYLEHTSRKPLYKFIVRFTINTIKSLFYYIKIRPKAIVTTGANSVVPICYIGKLLGSKVIYIESFARVNTLSLSGKILKNKSDLFFVQHEELKHIVKDAIYEGSLF